MKYLYKIGLMLALLCMIGMGAKSQESQVYHANYIGFSLSELIFTDFRFSYERRISPSHGIKLELAYKPSFTAFTDATNIDLGLTPTAWCYRNTARWYYVALGYRYYFNRNKTIYLSPEIFYKSLSANKIVFSYGVDKNSSDLTNVFEVRSMNANIMGVNLLIGKRMRFKISDNFNLGLDVFTGLTFRLKDMHTTTYGSVTITHEHDSAARPIIPLTDTPLEDNTTVFQGMAQFGIILYSSWR